MLIETMNSRIRSKLPSIVVAEARDNLERKVQEIMKGATTRAPTPSPSHHVTHKLVKFAHSAAPPAHKLNVPIVALTAGLNTAANKTNCNTPTTELKVFSNDRPRSKYQAVKASSVLPAAIPTATGTGT